MRVAAVAAMAAALLTAGCNKNMFDRQVYEDIMVRSFPTDTVDYHHDWQLVYSTTTNVTCDVDGTWRVCLLTASPHADGQALLMVEQHVSAGQTASMSYLLPKALQQMWCAAYDATGQLIALKSCPAGQPVCRLTAADVPPTAGGSLLSRQRLCYLYEAEFPRSGDWDYNDIVLTIDAPEPLAPASTDASNLAARQVRLHVTLQAVGCNRQVAAAIRFVGIRYGEVQSIVAEDGQGLVRNESCPRYIIKDDALLQRSENGEAVLCLFDDAHLAVNPVTTESGMVPRYHYNVRHAESDVFRVFDAPEATYVITFRDVQTARLFSAAALDPFIISPYNGANWEIHQYQYRTQETMFEYVTIDRGNFNTGISWCIAVPHQDFRHTTEGTPLGLLIDGIISGAYSAYGHSYGQWVASCNKSVDWYLYPSEALVY
ncbi:MAG: LruC domain-containing protein [Prevotella sp.]|nr:LruC domain-containing protein [Prevotella sp.]